MGTADTIPQTDKMVRLGEIPWTINPRWAADDDALVFAPTDAADNPLAAPLVATLHALRRAQEREQSYRHVLKQSVELNHEQQRNLVALRRRHRELLAQLRGYQDAAA